jgi:hypothetical protein
MQAFQPSHPSASCAEGSVASSHVPECDPTADSPDVEALRAAVAELRRGISEPGWIANIEPSLVQQLLAASISLYARKIDLEGWLPPFSERPDAPTPSATDVCLATTQLLEAVSVEVFELALWKTWAHSAVAATTDNDD